MYTYSKLNGRKENKELLVLFLRVNKLEGDIALARAEMTGKRPLATNQ
jgi:hypothetical protein